MKFKLAQGGSDVGVADVAAGRVTIGNSSRDPKTSDPGGLVFNKIAKDAICIVTNPDNKLAEPVAGADPGDLLRPGPQLGGRPGRRDDRARSTSSSRTAASGTQDAFQKIFMGTADVFSGASAEGLQRPRPAAVQTDKNAIGYVSQDFVAGHERRRPTRASAATCATAKSGQYGGVRNFWMVTRGRPRVASALQKFIHWIADLVQGARRSSARTGCPLK